MKRRNPVLNYLLTLVTGGQFGVVWLFLMAFDADKEEKGFVPRLALFALLYAVLYAVYLSLVGYNMYQIGTATVETYPSHSERIVPIGPLLLIAVALLAYPLYLLVKVAGFVRQRGRRTPSTTVLLLLSLVYFMSLPMLQNRLNALSEKNA